MVCIFPFCFCASLFASNIIFQNFNCFMKHLGNLVTEAPRPRIGDQIFQQLYQEASASTMANYEKGQYPVIPPVSNQPHFMQYTSQGLSSMPQQQPPQVQYFTYCFIVVTAVAVHDGCGDSDSDANDEYIL